MATSQARRNSAFWEVAKWPVEADCLPVTKGSFTLEEGGMTHSGNEGRTRTIKDCLYAIAVGGSVLLCLGFLFGYLRWGRGQFPIDNNVLILLFGAIAIALSPWLSRLKIGGLFELERLEKVEERQIALLRGEVVRDEYGKRFYIDDAGARHLIPDDHTARFLRSFKGEIPVSSKDLERYEPGEPMDSVLSRKPKFADPHIFAVLNAKRYHASIDDVVDWGYPTESDWERVTFEELRRDYPRGR